MENNTVVFDKKAFLAKYKSQVSAHRYTLLKQLAKKPWFQASEPSVQNELALLPYSGKENHDGFLETIIARKSEIGDIVVRRMVGLPRGFYTLCPIFEVQNKYTKRVYTYEFAAMRQGSPAGVKGLLLIRPDEKSDPTHIVILMAEKFATARKVYDLFGGMPEYSKKTGKVSEDPAKNAIREIQEETGVRKLNIDEVHILGSHTVDSGIASHESWLFTAFINSSEAKKISTHGKNLDDTEMNSFVTILPLTQLKKLINDSNDALMLAVILKATVQGHIPKKFCDLSTDSSSA